MDYEKYRRQTRILLMATSPGKTTMSMVTVGVSHKWPGGTVDGRAYCGFKSLPRTWRKETSTIRVETFTSVFYRQWPFAKWKPDAFCTLVHRCTRCTWELREILNVLSSSHQVGVRRTCGAFSPPERNRGHGPRCRAGAFVTAYRTGGTAENLAFRHTGKVGISIWTCAKCGREAVDASHSFVCWTSRVKLFNINTVCLISTFINLR